MMGKYQLADIGPRTVAMSAFAIAGSAWIVASILCGVIVAGWMVGTGGSFSDFDGIAGAALYFGWLSLISAFAAAILSLPWILAVGWPILAILRVSEVERWLQLASIVSTSAIVGVLFSNFGPWWAFPAPFVSPLYGVTIAYFCVRFDDA